MSDGKMIPVRKNAKGIVTQYRYEEPEVLPPAPVDNTPIYPIEETPIKLPQPAERVTYKPGLYQDRAKGFNITTKNLAIVTALAVGTLMWAIADDITLAAVIASVFASFAVVWIISFVVHTGISSEGAQLYEVFRLWNFLDREQRERHNRYRTNASRLERSLIPLLWFLAVAGLIGWMVTK